jgi:hypothetical protein
MDSMLRCILEELSAMEARLLDRIDGCGAGLERVANSKRHTSYVGDPIFDIDFVDSPMFDMFYDNLDQESFIDATLTSNHTSDTGLTLATPVCAVCDQFTNGPVFDTYLVSLDNISIFDIDPSLMVWFLTPNLTT